MDKLQELLQERAQLMEKLEGLVNGAETRDDPAFSEDEQAAYDDGREKIAALDTRIQRLRELTDARNVGQQQASMGGAAAQERNMQGARTRNNMPAFHRRPTADNVESIMCTWIRSGDPFAEREYREALADEIRAQNDPEYARAIASGLAETGEYRASNDTSMNITTAGDGGNLVPTGHYNRIIARRDEMGLRDVLNLMPIPGLGTTVNVPTDNEDDGEFVSTSEQNDAHSVSFDRDAPDIGQVAMTLSKYTKVIEITDELMNDNDSNLMAFLENWIGRGLAKTDNNLIVTEALADGTAALTFDNAASITTAEVPELIHLQAEGYENGSVWIMRKTTRGHIRGKTGENFQFEPTPVGGGSRRMLFEFPVYTTDKVPAIGAGNKSVIFGNFNLMGVRQMPGLTLLRDPYSVPGMLLLRYFYRVVFEVLQPEAILYGTHPTA